MGDPLIQARGLVKGYRTAAGYVSVLQGVDLDVAEGEMLAITGASGVGKSTLLHVLGTLDRPEAGTVRVAGQDVFALGENAPARLPQPDAGLRVPVPPPAARVHGARERDDAAADRAAARRRGARSARRCSCAELGLAPRAQHRPGALSGGEQQRVAVARALAQSPRVLLADEPTGNLDRETGERLHELLRRLNRESGITVVVVTHNEPLAAACDRTLRLESRPARAGGPPPN